MVLQPYIQQIINTKQQSHLNRYEKRLNPAYFIRIHRSYIINTETH